MIKILIGRKTTRAELGALVCKALKENLDDYPILVGGSVVNIYTKGRYKSDDLDIITYRDNKQISPVMTRLGFTKNGNHWEHPETDLYIQFLMAPALVGKKHVKTPTQIPTKVGDLPAYSPLEAACDRLAWVLDGDRQSLEQCVDLVTTNNIDISEIEAWLASEEWPSQKKHNALELLKKKVKRRLETRAKRRDSRR